VKDARIFVLGAAYKPDVGDVRESPSMKIMQLLHKRGARVEFHDPYVAQCTLNGMTLHRTELTNHAISRADLVAVLTPHGAYDLEWMAEHAKLVFDARNAFAPNLRPNVVRL
jgi:UDP-N-acetyl-D-glucosamine dehydrogenase